MTSVWVQYLVANISYDLDSLNRLGIAGFYARKELKDGGIADDDLKSIFQPKQLPTISWNVSRIILMSIADYFFRRIFSVSSMHRICF